MILLNDMYTATEEVIRDGKEVREVVRHIDAAFIPGLERIMNNVPVKSIELELENREEGISRRFYRVIKNF